MLYHAYNIVTNPGVGAPGLGKDVVYDLNATEKGFFTMLMTTVKLTGAATNNSHMVMHTIMSNTYINLSRVFQKNPSDPTHAHELIDHGKVRKRAIKSKWTDRDYHVKDNKYVQQKSVNLSCASMKFHALSFCVPHATPHGVRGLSKHHHLRLDPKSGNGKCEIIRIPCVCIALTNMLDKTWVIGSDPTRKSLYQPV